MNAENGSERWLGKWDIEIESEECVEELEKIKKKVSSMNSGNMSRTELILRVGNVWMWQLKKWEERVGIRRRAVCEQG